MVARKLRLEKLREWIERELNGYDNVAEIPSYRILFAQLHVWNPFHGLQSFTIEDPQFAELVCRCQISQCVGELEALERGKGDTLTIPFSQSQEFSLMQMMDVQLTPVRQISKIAIIGILHKVRNALLDWSLKLQDKILGEGMTFSDKEKRTAAERNYTINFHGPVHNSQLQVDTSESTQSASNTADFASLRALLSDLKAGASQLGLTHEEGKLLACDVKTIESQLSSPSPNRIILNESLKTIRNILEGCAGSLLATGLIERIHSIWH